MTFLFREPVKKQGKNRICNIKKKEFRKNNRSKKLIKIFFQLSVGAEPIHDDRNVVFFMILRSLLLLNTG